MIEFVDNERIMTSQLFDFTVPYLLGLFLSSKYPWDMLPEIKDHITKLIDTGIEGFTEMFQGVLVGEGTVISPTATIIAPAIIGKNCEVRPNAFIRGSVITGEGCVIGNASELKNCILLDHVQVPHYNYVGDSVLGNNTHMGAGAICSNLKGDKSCVTVKTAEPISSGLQKFGAILADGADIGCGCVLNPGTVICRNSRVYPLTSVRGVIPPNSIVKSANNVVDII